jgi:hypothetical protein
LHKLHILLYQATSRSFLINTQRNDNYYSLATTSLHPAPGGSHITPHKKRNSTANNTHYIISLEDPHAYVMRVTLDGPIRIQLHTLINIRGTNHSQVIHIHINPHTRSIIGRTYHQLFLTPGTQKLAPHITIPTYNPIKGITGRRADKLFWAAILLHNVDTLEVFEEAIRKAGEEEPAAVTGYNARDHRARTEPTTPLADPLLLDASSTSTKRGRGGGARSTAPPNHNSRPCSGPKATRTRTTHGRSSSITQSGGCRPGGGAPSNHIRARLSNHHNDHSTTSSPNLPPLQPLIPPTLPPLQPPNPATLNPTDPTQADPTHIQDEERFYDTEIEDELELPSTS